MQEAMSFVPPRSTGHGLKRVPSCAEKHQALILEALNLNVRTPSPEQKYKREVIQILKDIIAIDPGQGSGSQKVNPETQNTKTRKHGACSTKANPVKSDTMDFHTDSTFPLHL